MCQLPVKSRWLTVPNCPSVLSLQMSIANPEQFGAPLNQDYMEQEEEWEREGLLDPAWEKQQRKVRTYGQRFYSEKPRFVRHM